MDEEDIAVGHNAAYLPPGMLTKQVKVDSANGKVKLFADPDMAAG